MSTNQLADAHGAVQALLPWFANETLAEDEMALVREHLRVCPQCRDDAAWQQRLRAAEPALPPGLDPERALARLMHGGLHGRLRCRLRCGVHGFLRPKLRHQAR